MREYVKYRISLQHLKREVCEELLRNSGWISETVNYLSKKNFKKALTEYSIKYPEMNLEEINVMIHPMYLDYFNQTWTNDNRVNNERKYQHNKYFVNEGYLDNIENLGCKLSNGEKIERNWDITKHFIGQISLWDLNYETQKIILSQTGWLSNFNETKDNFRFAINNYTLHCSNSNLWNFRMVKKGDVCWDISRFYPYEI